MAVAGSAVECRSLTVFGVARSATVHGGMRNMRLTLRIPAVIAAVQAAQAWRTTAINRLGSDGTSAQVTGAVIGLLAVGATVAFGVVQVWRLRRSGLVVLGVLYTLMATLDLLAIHERRGNWLNVAFSAMMLIALLSPHAWRICAANEASHAARKAGAA